MLSDLICMKCVLILKYLNFIKYSQKMKKEIKKSGFFQNIGY